MVDDALGTTYAQDFDLNVDLDLVDGKDVASPTFTRRKLVHYNRPLRLGHCDSC
jgi:hypothetical protein